MNELASAFRVHKAFIPFVTCGDPDLETTGRIVRALAAAGADLIELGIPFSDPTAEGPVIQAANERALSAGTTTEAVFELVADLRRDLPDLPLAFMTYANVVYSRGISRFAERCATTGIGGLILPDVPFEEKAEFDDACRACSIDLVSMVAPTSEQRIAKIASEARGFLYLVSSLGVTGVRSQITTDLPSIVRAVRAATRTPCAIGFGISTPEQAKAMAAISDGAIVGSALVRLIAAHGRDAPEVVGEFAGRLAAAVHGAG